MADLIAQAPYIAALVIIVVIFTRHMDKTQDKIAENETKRDASWQTFLTGLQAQNNAALGRMSGEITAVVKTLTEVYAEQKQHDSWTHATTEAIAKALTKRERVADRMLDKERKD